MYIVQTFEMKISKLVVLCHFEHTWSLAYAGIQTHSLKMTFSEASLLSLQSIDVV